LLGNPGIDAVLPSALAHLADFPIRRMPLSPLLRTWKLQHTITP